MTEEENKIEKAESNKQTVTRPLTREIGNMGIVSASRYIQDIKRKDLEMPRRLCTYSNMLLNSDVATSVNFTNILVISALQGGQFIGKDSRKSKAAAEFLNYCIRNISDGSTWREAMSSAATDLAYGFSIQNIVLEKAKYGPYKGAFVLKKLAPRVQDSVYGWVWNKNNTELKGFVQKPMIEKLREPKLTEYNYSIDFANISSGIYYSDKYPFISKEQMLLFRHNPTNNNPEGNSPLNACYEAWQELSLISHYSIIGVSKDFGGLVIIRVPSELIEQANQPDKYPDAAAEYAQLQEDAANLQQGKSTHIVLVSDVDDVSKTPLYDLQLRGIDGGGKQYDTEDLINQRRRSIFNNFGTSYLLLGQNGHGSNALAGSQMTTHDYHVQNAIDWKVDVLNNQLAPRLLAANNIFLNWNDMPQFVPADPSKPDWDTLSKVLQRAGSVELLTNKAIENLYTAAGWETEGLDEFLSKREQMKIESRAGESKGSSGTGDSQAGGASSSTNMENKSLQEFVVDYETDDQIVAVNKSTGKPLFISKEG